MFAMYDDDGLRFRSTVERLYTVNEVSSSQSINNRQDDNPNKNFQDSLYNGKITKDAKDKYKQITNLNSGAELFHVDQIMDSTVITVKDNITIQSCYNIMIEKQIQQLPIIADTQLHLKGIITLYDILTFMMDDIHLAYNNVDKDISEISTKNIITTDPISDIRRVAKVMTDFNINAMPVVDEEDKLVGIVTRNNILKAIASLPHLQMWA